MSENTKMKTGIFTRWSYANVWEPKSVNGNKPKYSVSLIIPKSDIETISKVNKCIKAAYEEGQLTLKGKGNSVPTFEEINKPFHDGDEKRANDKAYKDSYYIYASSDDAPGIINSKFEYITDRSQVYSGVYGRASINFYAFNKNGNKGIACGLINLMKMSDGEPLGSKISAEADFAEFDEDLPFLD